MLCDRGVSIHFMYSECASISYYSCLTWITIELDESSFEAKSLYNLRFVYVEP